MKNMDNNKRPSRNKRKKGTNISVPKNVAAVLPEQQESALPKSGVAPPEIHHSPKPPSPEPAAVAVLVEPISSTVPPVPTAANVQREVLGVTCDPPESKTQTESEKSLSKTESTTLPLEGRTDVEELALVEEDLALVDSELKPVDVPTGTPYELRLGGDLESGTTTQEGTSSPIQVVLHMLCLPVTVSVHMVSTATQLIVGACNHVIFSTVAVIAGGNTTTTTTKASGVEDETTCSGSLVDEILHHTTHALPFALHVVGQVKDNIGGTLLGMISPFFGK